MEKYWEKPEYRALLEQWKDARLVGIIVREGYKTLEDFCAHVNTRDMLRIPNCGHGTVKLVIALAGAHNIPLEIIPEPPKMERVRGQRTNFAEQNDLFIWANHHCETPGITLKIGSRDHGRRVRLDEDTALRLAYKLMSLAKGGETQGVEKFT